MTIQLTLRQRAALAEHLETLDQHWVTNVLARVLGGKLTIKVPDGPTPPGPEAS